MSAEGLWESGGASADLNRALHLPLDTTMRAQLT